MPDKKKIAKLKELGADPDRLAKIAERDALIAREAAAAGRLGLEAHARKVAAEVRAEIAPGGKLVPEQGWLSFAPMPSDLCRVSPFAPMSKAEVAHRPWVDAMTIAKSSWGELCYTGPRLSVFEEDVFLALLALIDDPAERRESEVRGMPTTAWKGPLRQLLGLMGLTDGASNYGRVKRALRYMRATTFEITLKSGRVNGCGLIGNYDFDPKTKEVSVTVDPVFHELYSKGSVTRLDVERRSKLAGAVTKCLYRFVMSHKGARWDGHWMTVARAINLDLSQPDKELRRLLRGAVAGMIKAGILAKGSALKGENLALVRVARTLAHSRP
ncbi:RepB family plasmid replication initiator protein [Solidesulfovibrio carbinolicus]|uniref:Initiator Rep protein WH1 domain-containing protein n=1 Tax=Solidesulfovibrio carbinolicus TaxID=296842 RepID=A0A4P6HQV0_9BACT|nr:RepB family plasmid replication initiator protein [Solidesulfovibrio carbinolicus]QAZ69687.1 hypothetical protein C3Y92_20640 [Solidesulfovibrio carbinolicus]